MKRGFDATQLLDPGSWAAIAAWSGLVLIGLAILMTLLDWGELSGPDRGQPPRRRWAKALAAVGVLLIALAALGVLVLD